MLVNLFHNTPKHTNQKSFRIMFQDSEIISASDLGIACVQKKGSKGGPLINIYIYMYIYLDLPNDAKFLLFQKLLLFWGTCIFFCLRAFFGFGTFWGTWTSHHGADKHLKRRNFPSKKHNFPPKKHKNKSGWQAFPSSQNPKHETALLLEKSIKYLKQQKKKTCFNFER